MPSHSVSQSLPLAQLPAGVTTAIVTAALSTLSQIEDAGNPVGTDDAKPLPSTRNRMNYIILAVCTILVIVDLMARCVVALGFLRYLCCTLLGRSNGITVNSHNIVVPVIGLRACNALAFSSAYPLGYTWVNSDVVCWWWLLTKNL